MSYIFFGCLVGMFLLLPISNQSLEHKKLEKKYGKEKGEKIGAFLGRLSGWCFFILWIGLWISPQPDIPVIFSQNRGNLSFLYFNTNIFSIIVSFPLIVIACWIGIKGVGEISLKTAETHKTDKIVTTGLYGLIRHPQYLSGLIAHLGISILLSSLFSLIVFPLIIFLIYLMSKKEEIELTKEFGAEYKEYIRRVPMFLPYKKG